MTCLSSIILVAEDDLSGAVLEKLLAFSDRSFKVDRIIITHGNMQLKAGIPKFRSASHVFPHIILTDLDRYPCPQDLIESWGTKNLPPRMLFRIAVREVEAWLMADRKGIASFLHIDILRVPLNPENEIDPKRTLVNLAKKSRKRHMAKEIAPEQGSSAKIGPLYNSHMVNFVTTQWCIDRAIPHSPSLERTMTRISTFLQQNIIKDVAIP